MFLVGVVFCSALWHECLQVAQGHCPLWGLLCPYYPPGTQGHGAASWVLPDCLLGKVQQCLVW